MAMRNAVIPAPTKPIHQAPTHSGLSVVRSVLLGEAVVLGLLTRHPCPFQHMHGVACSLPLGSLCKGQQRSLGLQPYVHLSLRLEKPSDMAIPLGSSSSSLRPCLLDPGKRHLGLRLRPWEQGPLGTGASRNSWCPSPHQLASSGPQSSGDKGSAGVHRATHTGTIRLPTAICIGGERRALKLNRKSDGKRATGQWDFILGKKRVQGEKGWRDGRIRGGKRMEGGF